MATARWLRTYRIKVHNAVNAWLDEPTPIAFSITTGEVHNIRISEELEREVSQTPAERIFVNVQMMCDKGKQFIILLNPNVKVSRHRSQHYVYRHPKMENDLRLIVERIRKRKIFLLTNNWRLSPQRIVELYNGRWDSEVFHKEVKQYFSIKPIGQTWNALVIQILSVFIAYLLLLIFKFLHNHRSMLETKRIIAEGWWLPASEIEGKPPDTVGL